MRPQELIDIYQDSYEPTLDIVDQLLNEDVPRPPTLNVKGVGSHKTTADATGASFLPEIRENIDEEQQAILHKK